MRGKTGSGCCGGLLGGCQRVEDALDLLNNAIDWLSRPFGAGALRDKPLAVVGTSVGAHGGQWAHQDVQRSAKVAGAQVVEDIVLNHQYAWGSDPVADAATVELFVEALGKLTAYEVIAA